VRKSVRFKFNSFASRHKVSQNVNHSVNDKQVVKFAAGENHNVFLTDEGKVFTSGLNIFGQLGNGEDEEEKREFQYYPLKGIDKSRTVIQISCGSDHSFALTSNGEVYSWGMNFKG
jgi:E3 ubiquitin-protein ligase HERC4